MRTLILILVTSLTVLGADGNRFIKTFHYSTNLCLVVSEGEKEWPGLGCYIIRLHELTENKQLPAREFLFRFGQTQGRNLGKRLFH